MNDKKIAKKPIKKAIKMRKNAVEIKKVGRETLYNPKIHPLFIKTLAYQGLIESEMAEQMGIALKTLTNWKNKYPEFLRAIKEGKDNPDQKVVHALYENALGGEYTTKKPIVVSDGSQIGSHIEMVEVTERVPANVTAQIYWTKNRLPKEWKDKQDIEHSGTIETITPTKEQLQEIVNAIKSSRNTK
jgi:hypothetical protein